LAAAYGKKIGRITYCWRGLSKRQPRTTVNGRDLGKVTLKRTVACDSIIVPVERDRAVGRVGRKLNVRIPAPYRMPVYGMDARTHAKRIWRDSFSTTKQVYITVKRSPNL